ncbi:MAG: ribbon-helix-helix protein, CopG family [Actinomycetota bacterium]
MVWRARQPHISSGGRSSWETPVDLYDDHRHRLQALARRTDRSQAELIHEAIGEYLERRDVAAPFSRGSDRGRDPSSTEHPDRRRHASRGAPVGRYTDVLDGR